MLSIKTSASHPFTTNVLLLVIEFSQTERSIQDGFGGFQRRHRDMIILIFS